MRTGIIGLPYVGKTSLFKILTKIQPAGGQREAQLGVVKVPDERLDKLADFLHPAKLTHVSVEYVDVAALSPEALKEASTLTTLRQVDAFAHVVQAFQEPIHVLDDIKRLEFDFIVSDLDQVEKRLQRLEKEVKLKKAPENEAEYALLQKVKTQLESELPLRSLDLNPEDKKRLRGFRFLSEKPMLIVVNLNENDLSALESVGEKYQLNEIASIPNTGLTAICGKMEAELAEMSDADAAEFLAGFGLKESGMIRLIRKTYELLGLISFFTVGEDECRAWTITRGSRALEAAGTIHTDLAKHFIRAEVIGWEDLLQAGSEANARAKGKIRLEGKDYVVQDGDILHIRHSG